MKAMTYNDYNEKIAWYKAMIKDLHAKWAETINTDGWTLVELENHLAKLTEKLAAVGTLYTY